MFGKFLKAFGVVAVTVGILTLFGVAGNDCDGACGPGMDVITMLTFLAYAGIAITGGALCVKAGSVLEERH